MIRLKAGANSQKVVDFFGTLQHYLTEVPMSRLLEWFEYLRKSGDQNRGFPRGRSLSLVPFPKCPVHTLQQKEARQLKLLGWIVKGIKLTAKWARTAGRVSTLCGNTMCVSAYGVLASVASGVLVVCGLSHILGFAFVNSQYRELNLVFPFFTDSQVYLLAGITELGIGCLCWVWRGQGKG